MEINKDKFKKAILEKLGVSFEVIKDWQKNNAEAFCSKISEGKEFILQRFTNVSYDKRNTTLFTQYEIYLLLLRIPNQLEKQER